MDDDQEVKPLEELDIIEARELRVGQQFHAFRFRAPMERFEAFDPVIRKLFTDASRQIKEAGLPMDPQKLIAIAQQEAIEDNALSNFALGMVYAARAMKGTPVAGTPIKRITPTKRTQKKS
jgi:hypothetical protein